MPRRGEVLVAILKSQQDFEIARTQNWYRIPVENADRLLKRRWPPQWVAFYQPGKFLGQAFAVNYFAEVKNISTVRRSELFPDDSRDDRGEQWYYKIQFDQLKLLDTPIPSRRLRRIVFIPTTLRKLTIATEINDLFDDSPLENELWSALKKVRIFAERQEMVDVDDKRYYLDFAIYCAKGNLDVETDGDSWHANPERAPEDNRRDNDLNSAGWKVLRFSTLQVREQLSEYCVDTIARTVNKLGGIHEGSLSPRPVVGKPGDSYQLGLFGQSKEGRAP
jgi:very-short-patch-repair endonuclease